MFDEAYISAQPVKAPEKQVADESKLEPIIENKIVPGLNFTF